MLTKEDCQRLNHTEAYQLCRKAGIPCLPSTTKEVLIEYLLCLREPEPVTEGTHPFDSWRHGIAGFVQDYWMALQPQLTCPIKSGDFRSCFGCLDTQVVDCLVKNRSSENTIQLHRRRE